MSFSNPRRTPVTRPDSGPGNGLTVKTNLTLRKGATFHSPVTPPTSPPTAAPFRVPSLPRRSQTSLDDVVDAHVRRAALNIGKFEVTLSAIKAEPLSPISPFSDDCLPIPRGFLDNTLVGDTMSEEPTVFEPERRTLRPRSRRSSHHHESDSGLGTSIASTNQKRKEAKSSGTGASAITRSATASKYQNTQRLSSRARNRISEHILKPLLGEPSLKEFHPIVLDCPRRIQEDQIVCLRDLEKTLIFMAPVSQLMKDPSVCGVTYRWLCLKGTAKSVELYRDFCLTSIRCIQATVEYLSDREQTRPHDRPYNSGYFIDLVEQIRQHAQQMQEARKRQDAGEELDEMDVDPYDARHDPNGRTYANLTDRTDEVKLVGGLTTNGRPAELVRVKKNGKAISMATGMPVEDLEEEVKGPIRFKRSMSEQAEDEEEIMRSMARRKKNASPEELAPKKCAHPGCSKEFKRPCDLTKHEKTHSRPWKCPIPTCKYHDYGWPTEKEMDRHVNDKHSSAPPMFECHFKPCPYKSKRESNCKQHMEKAHGWTYVRTKTNGQKKSSKASSSAQPTPLIKSLPTPSSEQTDLVMTPPDDSLFGHYNNDHEFPTYPSDQEFNASLYEHQPFDGDIQLEYSPVDNNTPSSADSDQFNTFEDLSPEFTGQFEDIYGAHVQMPTPTHSVYNKDISAFANFAVDACQQFSMPQLSTLGQGNQLMLTPPTMVDEGFEDFQPCHNQFGQDFALFPPSTMDKSSDFTLFGTIPPSLAAGYSQPSSQDFNIEYSSMDWTASDFQGFPSN
ncbi:Zinc finger transcription factor ace1 [Daldinia childiae]|uniref:Zinc finger transcription factor ace1 n=1 Tax=Daldinia childiae TaxID=326645 RepID=UPI0014477BCA|nr:Zinc finger transcription factor ace1 [Daldinia childiae]KAF3062209.1 Zinc finger transcription factor ace1 [Daldinia childiae]